MSTMQQRLRHVELNKQSVDDLIELSAEGKILANEYAANGLSAPEWLQDTQRTLAASIQSRTYEANMLRLKEIEIAEAGLQTAAEKRAKLQAEKQLLQEKLGQRQTVGTV